MKTRTWRSGWGLVALWLLTVAIVMLLQSWLFEVNFLISLASLPLMLIIGIGLLAVLLAEKARNAALAFMVGTALIVFLPLNALGHRTWTEISFAQHRAAYEKIVTQAPGLPNHGMIDGESYIQDRGCVAFPRSQGIPDGWSGVVHDPTNALPLTDDTYLIAFGSNIQSCIRIERDWYRCWFD